MASPHGPRVRCRSVVGAAIRLRRENVMPASKIVNEQEVVRWFEEGKTYAEMVQLYLDKYNIETVPSMWGNFRRRRGLERRITRDDDLIPWHVQREHRWDYPILMLRKEARRRAGLPLSEDDLHAVEAWKRNLERRNVVVHYEPDTDEGWFLVPRRRGVDTDLIRVPERKTTERRHVD